MKIFILFILISVSSCVNGQISWERPYGGPHNPYFNDVIQGPGNFFYVCGKDTLNTEVRGLLSKLDSLGNVLWEKHYTVQDSNCWFDHLLLLDSTLIVQSATYAHTGGFYSVPKILKMDILGNVIDSVWPNIFDVYNQTGNINLYAGANHTFWAFTYIGTIGVSNEIEITRYDENLNILLNYYNGAFYDQRYSFNKKGEKVFDVFIDEYDSITSMITQPDHISLSDSAGFIVSDSIYFSLRPSDELLRTEDEGFSMFYSLTDSLVIRHFDISGQQQHIKYFNLPCYRIYPPVPAADSGYFLVTLDYDIQTNFWAYTIFKFNNADDTIWTQSFTPLYVNSFETIKPTADGGAIALFRTQHFGDSTNYLVRLGPGGERFPFTLQMNPHIFCIGDTVRLSTIQNAASYLWDTGDTTATLSLTSSGNYGVTVTDSAGNIYYVRPVAVQFESIQQVVQNDVHSCFTSIQLTQSAPNATTYWSNDRFGYATGTVGYYSTNTIPDTMRIWVMEQTQGGCRTIDTAFIFFDDCSGIPTISNQEDVIIIKNGNHSVNIQTISGKKITQIYLIDLAGKLVQMQSCNNSTAEIKNLSLSPRLYLLKCVIDGEVIDKKILITR